MKLEPLCAQNDHPELPSLTRSIGSGRYFRLIAQETLANILRLGSLQTLARDQYLIHEGDETPPTLYILVEGSLAVVSNEKFILRLDSPGDVVGEMAVILSAPRSADVIAETDSRLVVFPADLFRVDRNSPHASVIYVLFSHIMAAKLRITTAQSMIRKNQRVSQQGEIRIGIIDATPTDRAVVRAAISERWPEAGIEEFENPLQFQSYPAARHFDMVIADPDPYFDFERDANSLATLIQSILLRGASAFILSHSCQDAARRELLVRKGADEVMAKPCAPFDLGHAIARIRVLYYQNLELDRAESAAETDRLTGLANRRRLDQFLDALITVYPDNRNPFSLVISDVDNFKHYNDTHGHQMGDVVLESVAALLAKNVRRGDLAARFGGEEFVIVLPNCGKARALELAETLRVAVESADLPHQNQQPNGNLTLTLGVATYPDDATDLAALLKSADDCLYEGKRVGKNVVIPAG
ncbi:MAG: GGDEF domain-containing protein [Pseudomonadales bacterium]|nr:GGDEF domain-containing protein [Pseudomonadales bacterium]